MKKMFVYGTLRVGMYNYEKYYKDHDSFRRNAYVKGLLHTIRGKVYPALTEGERMILGEIHEVPDEVQDAVDLMEGFFGEGNIENEYDKIVSEIYDEDGTVIDHLPVYFYNVRNPRNEALLEEIILGNDYVAYLREKPFTCKRGGLTIRGMQYLPEDLTEGKKYPAVIVCHGFTGNYKDMSYLCNAFARAGYAAFSFSFCGGGKTADEDSVKSEGRTTDMSVMTEVEDVIAVKEFVQSRPFVDTEEIILAGESQGGFVAGLTAARCRQEIKKLIMIYPALCIPEHARRGCLGGGNYDPRNVPETIDCGVTVLGKAFHQEASAMEAYRELSPYDGEVLLLQGMEDRVVHYSYAVRAKECYRDGRCHLQLIRNLGHGLDEKHRDSVFASIRQFLAGRKEILTIRVIITHTDTVMDGAVRKDHIFFTGYCETEYFQGTVLPEGCDVQTFLPDAGITMRAEYVLKGLDRDGRECSIHIVNQKCGEDFKPTVETDSPALSWMNHADLHAVLEDGQGGPTVRIFA